MVNKIYIVRHGVTNCSKIPKTPIQNRDNTTSGADHRTTDYVKLDDKFKKSTTPGCIIS